MLLNSSNKKHETHLGYCTNIHAGESLEEAVQAIEQYVAPVRQALQIDALGLGLRLSGAAAQSLQAPEALASLQQSLDAAGAYAFTINGFPYGNFHGQPVKSDVYRPDWTQPERLNYTNQLADVLAELLPDNGYGTISTVPGTFKAWMRPNESWEQRMAANLVDHVAHLVNLRRETGKTIALALEPEPCCFLETIDEAIAFFDDHLFAESAVARLSARSGLPPADSDIALRQHLGLCYDVCHAAVEFENPVDNIAQLQAHGISVLKLQLSSALRVRTVNEAALDALQPYAEPVYLHQVVQRTPDGVLHRFTDLSDALRHRDRALGCEWRVHFHVPVFIDTLSQFDTTQSVLREVLQLQRTSDISAHLEVETYTWDVLPESLRQIPLTDAIARELDWVRHELLGGESKTPVAA